MGSKAALTAPKRDFRCSPKPDIDRRVGYVRSVPMNEPAHAGGAGGAVGGYVFGGNYLNEHR
jgi:hypothetical protein